MSSTSRKDVWHLPYRLNSYETSLTQTGTHLHDVLLDLTRQLEADFEETLTLVEFRTHHERVAQVIEALKNRTVKHADDAIERLSSYPRDHAWENACQRMIADHKIRMLYRTDIFSPGLYEVAYYGQARKPYIPHPENNEYRIGDWNGFCYRCHEHFCGEDHDSDPTPYEIKRAIQKKKEAEIKKMKEEQRITAEKEELARKEAAENEEMARKEAAWKLYKGW